MMGFSVFIHTFLGNFLALLNPMNKCKTSCLSVSDLVN